MSYYDPNEKVTSEGPDGFVVIDFSRFKNLWENVADEGEEPTQEESWGEFFNSLPEAPKEEIPIDYKFEKDVLATIRHMDVVEEAKHRRDERDKEPFEEPEVFDLADFLMQDDNPVRYKVDQLWPLGGNVLFAAPAKFGKSTILMNLIRALADGTAFLGEFSVQKCAEDEAILLIDLEMNQDRVRSELRSQQIQNLKCLRLANLRGATKQFDITDEEVRAYWVAYCAKHNVKTLILDPLAPILGYLNADENDNTTINRFFQQLDEFKKEAGIRDLIVAHHCGHTADWRPRGASRFNDWPDALWLCKLDGDLDQDPDRKFFARGRDVGDEFNGAGLITRDPQNAKVLQFTHGTAASRSDVNARGILNKWILEVFKRTAKAVSQKDLKIWAASQDRATPDGEIIVMGDDKTRGMLDSMEASGEIHGCNLRAQGNPKVYIPAGYACTNPHCGS